MKRPKRRKPAIATNLTGEAGAHFVACELSRRGAMVLPTTRNTKGFDLVCLNSDGREFFAVVQVKSSYARPGFFLANAPPARRAAKLLLRLRPPFDRPAQGQATLEAFGGVYRVGSESAGKLRPGRAQGRMGELDRTKIRRRTVQLSQPVGPDSGLPALCLNCMSAPSCIPISIPRRRPFASN